jgi:hypothetical protein
MNEATAYPLSSDTTLWWHEEPGTGDDSTRTRFVQPKDVRLFCSAQTRWQFGHLIYEGLEEIRDDQAEERRGSGGIEVERVRWSNCWFVVLPGSRGIGQSSRLLSEYVGSLIATASSSHRDPRGSTVFLPGGVADLSGEIRSFCQQHRLVDYFVLAVRLAN